MRVITCCAGKAFMIGQDIKINVVDIDHGHVRMSFDVPRKIAIHRHEHYRKLSAQAPATEKTEKD